MDVGSTWEPLQRASFANVADVGSAWVPRSFSDGRAEVVAAATGVTFPHGKVTKTCFKTCAGRPSRPPSQPPASKKLPRKGYLLPSVLTLGDRAVNVASRQRPPEEKELLRFAYPYRSSSSFLGLLAAVKVKSHIALSLCSHSRTQALMLPRHTTLQQTSSRSSVYSFAATERGVTKGCQTPLRGGRGPIPGVFCLLLHEQKEGPCRGLSGKCGCDALRGGIACFAKAFTTDILPKNIPTILRLLYHKQRQDSTVFHRIFHKRHPCCGKLGFTSWHWPASGWFCPEAACAAECCLESLPAVHRRPKTPAIPPSSSSWEGSAAVHRRSRMHACW